MVSSVGSLSQHRKLALLIGNGNYYRPDLQLSNSVKNVKGLSNSLKHIGFNVTTACNLGIQDMTKRIADFSKRISDGDLFLFYFCGHAYQVNSKNYLIPVGDAQIEREKDVEQFATDFEEIIKCIAAINPSYANIFILDCCGTYLLKSMVMSGSTSARKGLEEMESVEETFIQFACAANETIRKNLFTKHLLNNIIQENASIDDVFRRIANDLSQESNSKQQPLSINGLPQPGEVYLNQLLPPPRKWDEIRSNEIEPFLKKQAELRVVYDNFPDIDDVINRDAPDVKKAEELTQCILSEVPSGDATERSTLCHAIRNLLGDQNQECLFFDSREGAKLHDASGHLADLDIKDKPFVLKLNNNDDFITRKDPKDKQYDLKVIKTLDRIINEKKTDPVIDDILEKLSKAHNTDKRNIVIKNVYLGTFSIVYSVLDLKNNIVEQLVGVSKKLKKQFKQFLAAKIHPLLFRPAFDISQFDKRGNKTFTHSEMHEVGPPGRTETYFTPVGYTRYGLKVLGRFNNDTWLHPFDDPGNWYRAFHGTKNATAVDFGDSKGSFDDKSPAVVAFSNIQKGGFSAARTAVYGPGVYCSPKPSFVEKGFAAEVEVDTIRGLKKFKIMLQVAVNPDDMKIANTDIWVALHSESIRAYGILIKEV